MYVFAQIKAFAQYSICIAFIEIISERYIFERKKKKVTKKVTENTSSC